MKTLKHLSLVSLLAFSSSAFCMQQSPLPVETLQYKVLTQDGRVQTENGQTIRVETISALKEEVKKLKTQLKTQSQDYQKKESQFVQKIQNNNAFQHNAYHQAVKDVTKDATKEINKANLETKELTKQWNTRLLADIIDEVAEVSRYLSYHEHFHKILPGVVGGSALLLTTRTNIKTLAKVVIPVAAGAVTWQFGYKVLNAQWLLTNETTKKHWPLALALAMAKKADKDKNLLKKDDNFTTDYKDQLNMRNGQLTALETRVTKTKLSTKQTTYFNNYIRRELGRLV